MVVLISALLLVSVENLHYIHVVQAALLAVPLLDRLVEHLLRTNLRLVQLRQVSVRRASSKVTQPFSVATGVR